MAEIAREAGVSVATVSKVLNGRSDVATSTRRRVEELLSTRRYRPRRSRPARRAPLIDALDDPWAVEIIRGVEQEAEAQRMGVIISHTSARWIDGLVDRGAEGAILVISDLGGPERRSSTSSACPSSSTPPAIRRSTAATRWAPPTGPAVCPPPSI